MPAPAPATNQKPLFTGWPSRGVSGLRGTLGAGLGRAVLGPHPAPGFLRLATALLAGAAYFPAHLEPDLVPRLRSQGSPDAVPEGDGLDERLTDRGTQHEAVGNGRLERWRTRIGDDVRRVVDPDHRGGLALELLGEAVEAITQGGSLRLGRGQLPARLRAAVQHQGECAGKEDQDDGGAGDQDGRFHGHRPYPPRMSRRIRSHRYLRALSAPRLLGW